MNIPAALLALLAAAFLAAPSAALAQSRVKDVASVVGNRDNQLFGVGLVVGLNGTGDSDPDATQLTVSNMMRRFGLNVRASDVKAKNVAIVMVTSKIPAAMRAGAKLDIQVSSMADCKTLQGGTLLQTPLYGADGSVYAVAQGPLSIGGFAAGNSGASVQKNHPTVGRIPDGAIVEREIPTNIFASGMLEYALREPDFTSAVRMANAVNEHFGAPVAYASSASTVNVFVPAEAQDDTRSMEFVARVDNVVFRPDTTARIVINEKTGTIVANSKIRIDSVAVAHGNLTVSIVNKQNVSQPLPFTGNQAGNLTGGAGGAAAAAPGVALGEQEEPVLIGSNIVYEDGKGSEIQLPVDVDPPAGFTIKMRKAQAGIPPVGVAGGAGGNVAVAPGAQTVVTTDTTTKVQEDKSSLIVFDDMSTVQEVATALNALGVTPRDMMSIFQTMKQAGALQAELVMQ